MMPNEIDDDDAPMQPPDEEGDCSHGVHGPWCREWKKMKARAETAERALGELREVVEDCIQVIPCAEHGRVQKGCPWCVMRDDDLRRVDRVMGR